MDQTEYLDTVRRMIEIELEAMSFYRLAAQQFVAESTSFHFDLLADEELEHAREFYLLYPPGELPDFDTLVANWSSGKPTASLSDRLAGCAEAEALKMALHMEKKVESDLAELLGRVATPAARQVIAKNLESTHGHFLLIKQDLEGRRQEASTPEATG